jgi:hypothetical protein
MKLVNYKCFRREIIITLGNNVCVFTRFEMDNKIDYSVLKDYVQNLDLKSKLNLKIQITVKSFIKAEIESSNPRINTVIKFETKKIIEGSRQLVNFLLVK